METPDKDTLNIMKGLNLLHSAYPLAKIGIDYPQRNITFEEVEDDLPEETNKILEDWNWKLIYNSGNYYKYYWVYNWIEVEE